MTPPDEVLRKMAEAVDDGVRQALRDYGIGDDVIGADVERFAASMVATSAALAAAAECGWTMVPVEATGDMRCAGGEAQQVCIGSWGEPRVVWAAMLAAAPKVTP